MKTPGRVGVVLAGYAAAILAAWGATTLRAALTRGPDAQASAGMFAFGDALLFFGVLLLLALVPTVLALRWLRPVPWFWGGLALLALALAASDVVAAAWLELDRMRPYPPRAADGSIADAARIRASFHAFSWLFTTPFVAAGSALSALFAPAGRSRRGLFAAGAVALAVLAFSILRTLARPSD